MTSQLEREREREQAQVTLERSPSYWEGWQAHAAGHPLFGGGCLAYKKGWQDRDKLKTNMERLGRDFLTHST